MRCEVVKGSLEDAAPRRIREEQTHDRTKDRNRKRILGNIGELGPAFHALKDPSGLMRHTLVAMT
jgi:hypothetical protein